ncbi:hypothetical protein GCK32_015466, partial [Trichostrongylus colubriformis]
MDLTPETNPEFSKYMYEGDIMLTPDQAKDIIERQIASGADRKKRGIQTTSTGFWSPNNPINYTFDSSLHAFAVNVSVYTIQTLNPAYQNTIGQREQPAFSDVRLMNYAYNCSSFCVNTPVPACRAPGYPNPR